MHVWGRLSQFLRLLSQPKRDRDGTRADPSYFSDEAPNNEEGDTVSHRAIGSPEQVCLVILGQFAAFLQGIESNKCKGLGTECNKAFRTIKEYIASPLSLSQLVEGEELYIYLSSLGSSVSSALVRLDSKKRQRPAYFVSKVLSEVDVRYSDFERVALALRMVSKKPRPYFQAHTIMVLTSSLIRAIINKPNTFGRLLKWVVELSEFDIEYRPKTAIKGQVLADFIMERSEV